MNHKIQISIFLFFLFFSIFRLGELGRAYAQFRFAQRDNLENVPAETGKSPDPLSLFASEIVDIRSSQSATLDGVSQARVEWVGPFEKSMEYLLNLSNSGWVYAPETLEMRPDGDQVKSWAHFSLRRQKAPPAPSTSLESTSINPFKPLFKIVQKREGLDYERLKRDQARKEKEQALAREKEAALEKEKTLRSQLENKWILTGIARIGSEPLAFLQQRGKGVSQMVKMGEKLGDLKVTNINESEKWVVLNYNDQFDLQLTIQPSGMVSP